jgi:hypothetical protein
MFHFLQRIPKRALFQQKNVFSIEKTIFSPEKRMLTTEK